VFTLNMGTGRCSKTLDDPTMKPTASLQLGINGLNIRGGDLYYAMSARNFSRIPISAADATPTGPAEVIAKNTLVDDFSLDLERKPGSSKTRRIQYSRWGSDDCS
jgi:hypothetical protein